MIPDSLEQLKGILKVPTAVSVLELMDYSV